MKTIDELKRQYDEEENVFKKKRDLLLNDHRAMMNLISTKQSFEEFMRYIDKATMIADKLSDLDHEHKMFLLKWERRFHKRLLLDMLKNINTKGE